jgi:hypothetical protein
MQRSDRQSRRSAAARATQTSARASAAPLAGGRQVRDLLPRWFAALGLLLAVLLAASAQAQASVEGQRLHETKPSFGFPVKVVEQSKKRTPELSAMAVSAATGDVFVVESALGTVEEFEPEKNASDETVGEKFVQKLTVASAVAVAVDNSPSPDPSAGSLYVGTSKGTIVKFIPEGGKLEEEKIKGFKSTGGVQGLAIDGKGHVFVSSSTGEVAELNNAATNALISTPEKTELAGATRRGLAVGAGGELYVGSQGFSPELGENTLLVENREEFEALNPEYKATARYGVLAKLSSSGQILLPALSPEALGAVTANDGSGPEEDNAELGDLYVVNLSGAIGEKESTISEYARTGNPNEVGQLLQRFALPGQGKSSEGVGVSFDDATGELYVLDAASASVDVFKLAPEGAPIISDLSAESSSTELETWTLGGEVNANGSATEYHFEYGRGSCEPPTAACTSTSSQDLGASYGPQPVSVQLSALAPGTYHYRVVAENGHGTVRSGEQSFTIAATLTGLPDGRKWELVSSPLKAGAIPEAITNEGGLIQASEAGGAFTYVSNGPFAGQQPEGNQSPLPTQQFAVRGAGGWSSTDLNTGASVANGIRVGGEKEYRFFTPSLALSAVAPITGAGSLAKPPLAANETLQKSIYLRADAPLAPEASEEASFKRALQNGGINGNAGFLALANDENANIFVEGGGTLEFGGEIEVAGLEFEGANANLSDAVFNSLSDDPGLFEWTGIGQPLKRVNILPTGEETKPGENAKLGLGTDEGLRTQDAISSDGTRVIWTDEATKHLYMRDTATEKTVQLDAFQSEALEKEAAESSVEEDNPPKADYAGASADDSRVFFTDTQRLTADSHATENSPDLYVYEFTPLGAELHDLTPQPGAAVQVFKKSAGGGVAGVSEDGAYVYYVANGALTPGTSPGGCSNDEEARPPGATCNLYVSHYATGAWETKLVAVLSEEDSPDWGDGHVGNLGYVTARVSPSGPYAPSGQYFAFMSDRNLTGYEPVEEEARGGHRDEEVYLYNAATGHLTCASCSPNGAPPVGVQDVGVVNSGKAQEGLGLLVDRPQIWAETEAKSSADHWLAGSVPGWTPLSESSALYQSRYLGNNGHLFFNSPAQLVPGVGGQKEMVYEYEPNGAGSCASEGGCVALVSGGDSEHEQAFLDASASGNDVFFLSTEPLAPNPEGSLSVYDAHVCETGSPCTAPEEDTRVSCEEPGHACRNAPEPFTGGSGSPASETTSGAGNITPQLAHGEVLHEKTAVKPLTRAQKLAAALKACKKDKKKTKREACEKTAHKKYGPPAKKSSKKTTK